MGTGKPLVSYYYGQSEAHADAWLHGTRRRPPGRTAAPPARLSAQPRALRSSGSLAINAGPMRMQSNFNAAIHGVGNSGLGGASIWGETVFNTFSHSRHVVRPKDGAFAGSIWGSGPYLGSNKVQAHL